MHVMQLLPFSYFALTFDLDRSRQSATHHSMHVFLSTHLSKHRVCQTLRHLLVIILWVDEFADGVGLHTQSIFNEQGCSQFLVVETHSQQQMEQGEACD